MPSALELEPNVTFAILAARSRFVFDFGMSAICMIVGITSSCWQFCVGSATCSHKFLCNCTRQVAQVVLHLVLVVALLGMMQLGAGAGSGAV
mgnify:CR=1 FL=1